MTDTLYHTLYKIGYLASAHFTNTIVRILTILDVACDKHYNDAPRHEILTVSIKGMVLFLGSEN